MTDDETIALRDTVIGSHRQADDFTVIWRDLPIGRIMKIGVSSRSRWWERLRPAVARRRQRERHRSRRLHYQVHDRMGADTCLPDG